MNKIASKQNILKTGQRLVAMVLLLALGLSLTPTVTYAVGGILADATSCTAFGGTWDAGTNTCTVTSLQINSGETLQINPGATLVINGPVNNAGAINNLGSFIDTNTSGALNNTGAISNGGTLNNAGALANNGTINNNNTGTINNNSLIDNNNTIINNGSINNNFFGTINNNAGGAITSSGMLNNDGVINNNAGSSITNAGAVVNTRTINGKCGAFNGFPAAVAIVDQCPPIASITAPANNAVYLLDQVVAANYSCTDEAGGSGIASCVGAVPSGSNINTSAAGALTFVVTATDNAGNVTTVNSTYTVLVPRDYLQLIRDNVVALRATVSDKPDGDKLDKALKSLNDALGLNLWRDSQHPDAKNGDKVFKNIKDAADSLEKLLKDKKSAIPDATLQTFINQLVAVAGELASISINEATQASGDPKELGKAQDERAKGDSEFAAGKYPKAIDHYGKAWQHALKAASRVKAADAGADSAPATDDSTQSNVIFLPLVINQ